MSEDHAARTLPAMADKALSVCVMMNKLDRIKIKADYQFMHEIEICINHFKYSFDFPKKYQTWEFIFFPQGNFLKIKLTREMFQMLLI